MYKNRLFVADIDMCYCTFIAVFGVNTILDV